MKSLNFNFSGLNSKVKKTALVTLVLVLVFGNFFLAGFNKPASAQTEIAENDPYYLKIDGIDGGSMIEGHLGEIELLSYSFGATNKVNNDNLGGGNRAGKANFQDFHFTSKINKASPKLFEAVVKGNHIKNVVLTAEKGGEDHMRYLRITLSDVLISSYQQSGNNPEFPTDSVSLNFTKISYEYFPQSADGSVLPTVQTSWDLVKGKSL